MIRSLSGKFLRVTIRNGSFVIKPLRRAYREYRETFPRLTYNSWAGQNEDRCFVEDDLKVVGKPLISVIIPAYNPVHHDFLATVYSVINQHYENWELVIVNASDQPESRQKIDQASEIDTRINIVRTKNKGIAANTNLGLKNCRGDFIVFLDHDDLLHACALHSAATAAEINKAELIYTDEDKIKADNSLYFEPLCKPRWSPNLLRNVNYINHMVLVSRRCVMAVGGLRAECDGAQDYDFLLRVIDVCNPVITHVPHVLYHWRATASSTAANFSAKSYALRAGVMALQQHLERNGLKGKVSAISNRPGFYHIDYKRSKNFSLIIGRVGSDNRRLALVWVKNLLAGLHTIEASQVIIGEWAKNYPEVIESYKNKLIYVKNDKTYWLEAAKAVDKKLPVLVMRVAALPKGSKELADLIGYAQSQNTTIAAPILLSEDNVIIDCGFVESSYGLQPLFTEAKLGDNTYYGSTEWVRDVAALSLNVFAAKPEVFKHLVEEHPTVLEDGEALHSDDSLNQPTHMVINPLTPFYFKGYLRTAPIINDSFFNPDLTKAFPPSIGMRVSAWGRLKEESEHYSAE